MRRTLITLTLALSLIASPISARAAPALTLTLNIAPTQPLQGDVVIVRVGMKGVDKIDAVQGELSGQPFGFVLDRAGKGPGYIGLVGNDALRPLGEHRILVTATLVNGQVLTQSAAIDVQDAGFITEQVEIPKQLASTIDPAVSAKEEAEVRAIYSVFTPKQLWRGAFRTPLNGKILSTYGNRRVYNGIDLGTFHGGADFYGLKGRPVLATAAGTVVLAKQFPIRGNLIVLDHGRGVFSSYAHLSKILVKKGDAVVSGRKIGEVGTTGRSQGNHLHFEIAVGGSSIEPTYWLSRTLP